MKFTATLPILLNSVYRLLKKTQPIDDPSDVAWWGPYVMPSRGLWCPSHFVLYHGVLYARLQIPPGSCDLSWEIGGREVKFETHTVSGYVNGEALWEMALGQIERRLKKALKNFSGYNRFVEKHLPPSCRTGKIRRDLTWPRNFRPIPERELWSIEKAFDLAMNFSKFSRMTRTRYLKTAACAYDAVFKELRPYSPLQKYKKKADGRHGGLLDLPPNNTVAFQKWFCSRAWSGCHPWEIVFGHPHGIMISPRYHADGCSWDFVLWVDSPGWFVSAVRMAKALAREKIPFELQNRDAVLAALHGRDEVEVGPDLYSVQYSELAKERPDSLAKIRWDPIPQLSPIMKPRLDEARRAGG